MLRADNATLPVQELSFYFIQSLWVELLWPFVIETNSNWLKKNKAKPKSNPVAPKAVQLSNPSKPGFTSLQMCISPGKATDWPAGLCALSLDQSPSPGRYYDCPSLDPMSWHERWVNAWETAMLARWKSVDVYHVTWKMNGICFLETRVHRISEWDDFTGDYKFHYSTI